MIITTEELKAELAELKAKEPGLYSIRAAAHEAMRASGVGQAWIDAESKLDAVRVRINALEIVTQLPTL